MYLNVAAAVVSMAYLVTTVVACNPATFVQLVMLLGLVWLCLLFPEAVGSYVGPWGHHQITEATPPFLVRGGAFVLLTLPPVVTVLIQ